ncbi:MAG TPA: NADH:ubiquinone oxidoreductase, partial [Anaerolineae bacterium]|nr:NADH:ubiquinone oxidoreductase [Anaerolineae bacterium]
AYGSCAYEGCIPALANLGSRDFLLNTVYVDQPTNDNPNRIMPQPRYPVDEGVLELPVFYDSVKALDQVVEVDYLIPGCPPEPHQVWAVMQVVINAFQHGAPLPPKGSIVGAGDVAMCEECPLEKSEKSIARFYRPYEITPEPGVCLLEQGIICMGPATRSGCGALCPQVGMGCRGCYGPPPGVYDQGAKMLSAIASVIAAGEPGQPEEEIERDIQAVIDTIPDPAGTFYRFSMAHSLLHRARIQESVQ